MSSQYQYGETRNVSVLHVIRAGGEWCLLCQETATETLFTTAFRRGKVANEKGDRGVITYKAGGLRGGHWEFRPVKAGVGVGAAA